MDVAYDHIQEEALPRKDENTVVKDTDEKAAENEKPTLNAEFQEAYKSISTTAWGAKLGGFISTVQKQGSTFYDEARQEASAASGEALKGFQDLRANLVSRARSMSLGEKPPESSDEAETTKDGSPENSATQKEKDALTESEGVVSRFKAEAAKRLKELEKAEEAADAAILRFGSNIGNFLKEAVTIAPPSEDEKTGKSKILFESKTEDGKRVIHSTRLEAQLHAIHTSEDKFLKDPESPQWADWKTAFDVEEKTQEIEKDLERFEELRKMMERCVPEKVEYADFWRRYYFLRDLVEKSEQRRREVLQGNVFHQLCPPLPLFLPHKFYKAHLYQVPQLNLPKKTSPGTTTTTPITSPQHHKTRHPPF